jgi:hypothetical protein
VNKIKKTLVVIIGVFFVGMNSQAQKKEVAEHFNVLSKEQKKEGWQLLFDGKSTNGWRSYNKAVLGSAWKIEAGTLHLDASQKDGWQTANGGDIVFDKVYKNFVLKTEWKVAKGGNSGVMLYVQEEKQYEYPWQTGIECQVLDNQYHGDGKIDKCRAGDLYALVSCTEDVSKGANQWNQLEIISNNGKIEVILNGKKVISTILWDENWKQLIAKSKFKDMPGFGSFHTGKISLQDHNAEVWYRNIMIKELK